MTIIDFTINVDNAGNISSLYDRIQVWRSPDNIASYVDITADESTAASLDGSVASPWAISGQELEVILDGADPVSVTFTGTNPLTLAQVLDQINAVFPDLASEVPTDTGRVRLTSATTGTQSILELSGAAATTLGLSAVRKNGKAARPLLAASTQLYEFRDYDGADLYYYKTRYYNSETGAVSVFSEPHQGNPSTDFPSSAFLLCFLYLADGTGKAIVGRRIIFVPTGQLQVTDNNDNVYGILTTVDRIEVATNDVGYAEVSLAKGQTFKVFIEGSTLQRQFTVPSTGTSLNILTALTTADDPFTIVTSPPMPIRMS